MKVVLTVGTRPEIINSVLLGNLLRREMWLEFELWHTGQHYDYNLGEIFVNEMAGIKPTINMNIRSGTHARQLSKIMVRTEKNLKKYKPDLVIVIGDTNSTLGVTLASRKLNIPVAHIEAGPREQFIHASKLFRDKKMMEFPEEVNRTIIDHCSSLLFAPTNNSVENLKAEHVLGDIHFTGNIAYDTLLKCLPQIKKNQSLSRMGLEKGFNLVTLHREENTDNYKKLKSIITAFEDSKSRIVFPMHPRTRNRLRQIKKLKQLVKNPLISICEPLGFYDFTSLLRNSRKVFTDSGGVQAQAFWLKVPCITLRENTGWVETVLLGANKLVGADKKKILLELKNESEFPKIIGSPFGDGTATKKILRILKEWKEINHKT